MSDKHRWRTNILLGLGSLLFMLVVVSLVGEWAVRYRERNRDTVPGSYASLFYQHRRLRHALTRSHEYYGWVRVNQFGFRGSDVTLRKPPDVTRILTVGGSTTFDRGVTSDNRTWPARLAYWLNAAEPHIKVEVVNAGVPGYTVLDNAIRLQTELYRFEPDIIILYHAHNDLFSGLRPRTVGDPIDRRPDEIDPQTPWTRWLSDHSLLYVKVQARLRALRPVRRASSSTVTSVETPVTRVAEDFERDLTAFVAIAQSLGIRVVLPTVVHVTGESVTETDPAIRSSWQRSVSFTSPETVLAGYVAFNEAIQRVAHRSGAMFVPTFGFGLSGPEWYEADDPIHFNDRGAERMAKHLAAALVQAGLFEDPRQFSLAQ